MESSKKHLFEENIFCKMCVNVVSLLNNHIFFLNKKNTFLNGIYGQHNILYIICDITWTHS